jgi:endonuclease YncB( thermonuclease family)
MLAPYGASAEQFTGKVVGISDGDTLSVLREGKAIKVRLHGVDTPEKAQAFGTQAQKLTGNLVFQQTVAVVIRDTDRYGRVVGEVLLPDDRSLNQELVKAGMAWWYRQYAPNDTTLAQLETEARTAKRGPWTDAHPVPHREWRKERREPTRTTEPVASTPSPEGPIIANQKSKVYHWPGCPDYENITPSGRTMTPARHTPWSRRYLLNNPSQASHRYTPYGRWPHQEPH